MGLLGDPERCPRCRTRGTVVESRHEETYRRRRRQCPTCSAPWTSYESCLNVQPILVALAKAGASADDVLEAFADFLAARAAPPRGPAAPPPPAAPPAAPPRAGARRVTRSPYIG